MIGNVAYKIVNTIFSKLNFEDFGTYHIALEGETNWYQYACFVADEAIRLGLKTSMTNKDIHAISSDAFPMLAKRPMNSRLNTTKIKKTFMLEFPHWTEEVAAMVKLSLNNT